MPSTRQVPQSAAAAAAGLPTRQKLPQASAAAVAEQPKASNKPLAPPASVHGKRAGADQGPPAASKEAVAAPRSLDTLVDRVPLASPAAVGDAWRLSLLRPQAGEPANGPFSGPLLITHHLARGSYGKVHVGLDEAGVPLAIKQLRLSPRMPLDAVRGKIAAVNYTSLQSLQHEVAVMALPCTEMRLHGILLTSDHRAFVATDLAAGSLGDFLDSFKHLYVVDRRSSSMLQEQRQVLSGIALRVVEQASRQLQALEAKGIAHHDIKPDNLLLTNTTPVEVKLWDFGMARRKRETGSFTPFMGGTPNYLSPERLQGRRYDFSTDAHSLGCVVVNVLVDRPVFDTQSNAWPAKLSLLDRFDHLHAEFETWHATKQWTGSPTPIHAVAEPPSETAEVGFIQTYELVRERFPHLADFVYGTLLNPNPANRGSHAQNARLAQTLREAAAVDAKADIALDMFASRETVLTEAIEALTKARAEMVTGDRSGVDPKYVLDRRPKKQSVSADGSSGAALTDSTKT